MTKTGLRVQVSERNAVYGLLSKLNSCRGVCDSLPTGRLHQLGLFRLPLGLDQVMAH